MSSPFSFPKMCKISISNYFRIYCIYCIWFLFISVKKHYLLEAFASNYGFLIWQWWRRLTDLNCEILFALLIKMSTTVCFFFNTLLSFTKRFMSTQDSFVLAFESHSAVFGKHEFYIYYFNNLIHVRNLLHELQSSIFLQALAAN